jgi:uncharacterized membrane protein
MTESSRNAGTEVDLEEVARLVDALERDLAQLKGSPEDLQALHDEIATLKNVLKSPIRRHHWVRDALHDMRTALEDRLDSAVAGGMNASRYAAEIGRILGL